MAVAELFYNALSIVWRLPNKQLLERMQLFFLQKACTAIKFSRACSLLLNVNW